MAQQGVVAGKKLRVFISYARIDLAFADRIYAGLFTAGLDPKIDRRDLSALSEFDLELSDFIRSADAVVFIISKQSVLSEYCRRELKQAAALNKRLAPIVLQRVPDKDVPSEVAKINFIFFDDESEFQTQLNALAAALQTDLAWVKEHTRLGELALRWEAKRRSAWALLRGGDLDDAETWLTSKPATAPEPTALQRDYVIASRRWQRFRQRLYVTISVVSAAVFAVISVIAVAKWQDARRSLKAATEAISTLIDTASDTVRPVAQLGKVEAVARRANAALRMQKNAELNPLRARSLLVLVGIDWDRGQLDMVRQHANEANELLGALKDTRNSEITFDQALIHHWLGLADYGQNKSADAQQNLLKAIDEINSINSASITRENWLWNKSLAGIYQDLGDVFLFQLNQPSDALRAYTKARDIRITVQKAIDELHEFEEYRHDLQHDLGWSINKLGDVSLRQRHFDEALKYFREAHDTLSLLNNGLWENLLWAEHLALTDGNLALLDIRYGEFESGKKTVEEGEAILQQVLIRDPQNELHRSKLIWVYGNDGILLYRWALTVSDSTARLHLAQEALNKALAEKKKSIGYQRPVWELQALNVKAYGLAVRATIDQQEGRPDEAARGFLDAAQMLEDQYLHAIKKDSEPDMQVLVTEFLIRAAGVYTASGKQALAQGACEHARGTLHGIANPDAGLVARLPKDCGGL